ncbi:hypothetical protein GCM10027170_40010 [Aliiglaciecola aliphaticivorans]
MLRRIKQAIVHKCATQKTTGFIVERLDCNQISGWIVPQNDDNPKECNFQVIESGRVIDIKVRLFHRANFEAQNAANLFGFRISFKQQLVDLSATSFFYIDGQNRLEPHFLAQVSVALAEPSCSVYFLNKMVSQKLVNAETLPSKEALTLLNSSESGKNENIEEKMTELLCKDISAFHLQAGLKSKSGVAITGKSGHLFLHGGSNKVDELFQNNDIHIEKVPKWLALFSTRKERAEEANYCYVQFVIPEKQTLMTQHYYRNIDGPSQLLKSIEESDRSFYFSMVDAFAEYDGSDLFFKTDSHLNAKGTYYLFKELVKYLGLTLDSEPQFRVSKQLSGDLGRKYYPFTFWEEFETTNDIPKFDRQVKYKFIPANKAHMGRHIHWVNPDAIFEKKVLIFGNSFCEMGTKQHHLTWWFSQYFSECQFVWSGDFNNKLIDKFQPDIVIGQSIERFLRLVPNY